MDIRTHGRLGVVSAWVTTLGLPLFSAAAQGFHKPARHAGAMDVVMVGGVPGAGKTTALRELERSGSVHVLDPESIRDWCRARFPATPYRRYRWFVHLAHTLRVLVAVLAGPRDERPLLVHDPATRPRRRAWFARLARRSGWRPSLVLIDVERAAARQGQLRRGRVVEPSCFDAHWRRWVALRASMEDQPDRDHWHCALVVDRDEALVTLRGFASHRELAAA